MTTKNIDKFDSINYLDKLLIEGDVIYTSLSKVSSSGMYRHIKPYVIKDNKPLCLTWYISQALELPYKEKTHSIGVSGCGMDMGFHLVDILKRTLNKKLSHQWI